MPRARERPPTAALLPTEETPGDLPYTVEHWDGASPDGPQVIARAVDLALAEAIFSRAAAEYASGAVVLRQGEQVLRRNGH